MFHRAYRPNSSKGTYVYDAVLNLLLTIHPDEPHKKHNFFNWFICSKWIGAMAVLTNQSYEKGVYTKRERSMGNPRVHQKNTILLS